jgi:hypothetical protein
MGSVRFPCSGGVTLRLVAVAWIILSLGSVAKGGPVWAEGEREIKLKTVHLEAGGLRNYEIPVGLALAEGVDYEAKLEDGRKGGQPEFGFFNPSAAGEPLTGLPAIEVRRGETLHLRAIANRCSPALKGEARILVAPEGPRPAQRVVLVLPFQVDGGVEECKQRKRSLVGHAALFGTFLFYLHGMFANSHFLSKQRLALRLKPLLWDGKKYVDDTQTMDVQQMVERELRFSRRAWNWLRANPLAFGLPGRAFYETAQLTLDRRRDGSGLILVPHRNFYRLLDRRPERGIGGIFATAWGELTLFGVSQGYAFSGLELKRLKQERREQEPKRIDLRRGDRLLYSLRSDGRVGWEM